MKINIKNVATDKVSQITCLLKKRLSPEKVDIVKSPAKARSNAEKNSVQSMFCDKLCHVLATEKFENILN